MSSQRKCPDCGSSEIVEDSHYAQNQLVCADCGFILTEGLLTTTYTDEKHLQEVTYSRSTGQNEQLSRSVQRGIGRVRDLCKVLQLPSLFEDTAVTYYQQAIRHPCFHLVSLNKKEILVGCSVFVTCRQHNWPLTMGSICLLLYAEKELFAKTYLSFLKELALDVPALSLVDLVKTHLDSFKLFPDSPSVPSKFVEDKEKLVTQTTQVVELASETWLVTGRHPIPIVTAAAYLAWQSLCPAGRLTCTLSQFCKLAGTDLPPPARQRLKELHNILLKMASELSWLRVLKVNKKSIAKYIADLLQHRRLLLRTAFRTGDSAADDPSGDSTTAVLQTVDAETEGTFLTGQKRKCGSQQPPLLPPCLLNPRKKLRTTISDSELSVTGDEPILDSEIEQYLRTPEEKERFSKAQACL
ncbi:transcription factor IIIB 50 kDa subunit [Heteronotia binoei]|uniref:transcription factor IIIB 50 kDa subunit n=1 Tax=Heteronotia binoei TaxID=13085 RepID=UPI00292D6E3C|nr:transcription factor IIIB 50 kDa subunit [Heteronotia binoei]XP_060107868.1 transcription factor IIIB 50 kDa subunit [Heteronotia binoei]